MFQRILCPVNFSPTSEHAIRCALDVGRKFHARIYILHVMDETIMDPLFLGDSPLDSVKETLMRKAERAMDEFICRRETI